MRLRPLVALGCLALATCARPSPSAVVGQVEFAGSPGSGEPNLHATGDGRAVLTWLEPITEESHALRLAVREGDGWSAPRTVRESRRFFVNWADFPSLVELSDGSWAVHWLEKVADATYAYHVKLAVSHDGGRSWSEPIVPHRDDSPTEHGFVAMVPWGEARAALVWLDGREMVPEEGTEVSRAGGMGEGTAGAEGEARVGQEGATAGADGPPAGAGGTPAGGAMTVRFTTLSSDGTLGAEVLLDDRVCECCQTALARTSRGLVAAYRDRSPEEVRDIYAVTYEDGAWGVPRPVARDGWVQMGCPVNGPQLDADGERVAVAWFTAAESQPRVYAAFSGDAGATFGKPVRVDGGDPLGRVDVALLSDGSAAVTWLELSHRMAGVLVRRVFPDGRRDDPIRVSETAASRASGFPRAVRVGDELLVSWTVPGPAGGIRVRALGLGR